MSNTKKGSLFDLFLIMLIALGGIVSVIVVYTVVSAVKTNTSVVATFAATGTSTSYFDNGLTALRTFDYGIALFIFTAGFVAVALATMINTHPVFFFGSLLVLIIIVAVSAVLSNVIIDVVSQDALSAATNSFPISMMILGIYPTLMLVLAAIVSIVQYTRTSSTSGFGGY